MKNQAANSQNSSYLYEQKRKLNIKLIEAKQEMVTHDSNYDYKRNMFLAAKEQNRSLLDQYNDLTQKKIQLEKTHRETNTAGQQIEYLRDEIQEIKNESRTKTAASTGDQATTTVQGGNREYHQQ